MVGAQVLVADSASMGVVAVAAEAVVHIAVVEVLVVEEVEHTVLAPLEVGGRIALVRQAVEQWYGIAAAIDGLEDTVVEPVPEILAEWGLAQHRSKRRH